MIQKIRRTSPVIEAVQWTGENATEIAEFVQGGWDVADDDKRSVWIKQQVTEDGGSAEIYWLIVVPTNVGDVDVPVFGWIVRDHHVLHTYDASEFAAKYEVLAPLKGVK